MTVGGNQYDVTTFTGDYNDYTAYFDLPANSGRMPWWGNGALASEFAAAVSTSLGSPNTSIGCSPASACTPFFAFELVGPPGNLFIVNNQTGLEVLSTWFPTTFQVNKNNPSSWTYAQVAPASTSPVPGPLPVMGAAAAFGMSRRLRGRIASQPFKL